MSRPRGAAIRSHSSFAVRALAIGDVEIGNSFADFVPINRCLALVTLRAGVGAQIALVALAGRALPRRALAQTPLRKATHHLDLVAREVLGLLLLGGGNGGVGQHSDE